MTVETNADRRNILTASLMAIGGMTVAGCSALFGGAADAKAKKRFPVTRTAAEWKKRLTSAEYYVLRQEGTEKPYSSPLDKEKRAGIFACAGCGQNVYSSKTKYDSGTGWPSFWDNLPGKVGTSIDRKIGFPRTEVHCSRCGGHLGHIFNDGPKPTGKRHCLNGVALDFKPA